MTARLFRGPVAAALTFGLVAAARTVCAQGTLSGQGFGYPTGQLSTRALATGGSMAELDPLSPVNPAALATFGRAGFFFQYDPEFRRVSAGGGSQSATITRFPVIGASFPVARRAQLGLTASTYLDRTFATTTETETDIGGEVVSATENVESRGSVTDLRLGAGYYFSRRFRVGIAGHALTGENRIVSGRVFSDTSRFGRVADSSRIDYSGIAASAGVAWEVVRGVSLGGSYRKGGTLRTERNDSTLTRADAPDRAGVSLRVDRVAGASLGVSYSRHAWSKLRSLGTSALRVSDGSEFAVGGEAIGPRYGNNAVVLRLGARQRDLPFGVGGGDVRERAFAGGVGVPLGAGTALGFERASIDLSLQRASRTLRGADAGVDASERAWTISVGVTVRP